MADLRVERRAGLICRSWPETVLPASNDHQRIAIWIPNAAVRERLSALMGHPVPGDIVFQPLFYGNDPNIHLLRSLVDTMLDTFGGEGPRLSLASASRSFGDFCFPTLLRAVPQSHSALRECPVAPVLPRTQRRAEEFI